MTERQDWLKTGVLLGMGVYLAVLLLTGSIANYMNLRFVWLVYLAAGLCLLLGAWNLAHLLRGQALPRPPSHARLTWTSLLVMALPLALGVLVPSRPLDINAVNAGVSMNAVGARTAAYQKPPLERNILDWLREFNATNNAAAFDGQPVDVIGFVYREPSMAANQFMIARFTMSCCVADALAVGMPVEYADAAALVDGDWVRIQGTLRAGTFGDTLVPIIQPATVAPTEAPATAYLYS